MYETLRYKNNKDYWQKRWSDIPADESMANLNVYPLKYALMCVQTKEDRLLEAGCGNGRLLRYFYENGYLIKGMDFIVEAVKKIRAVEPKIDVEVGDITELHYENNEFNVVFAFGLYHNLRGELLEKAISESARVLAEHGRLCASFRADNWANRMNDWYANYKARKIASVHKNGSQSVALPTEFHKLNLTEDEFRSLVERHGFVVDRLLYVENMPFLYKFRLFRHKSHKDFNESRGRREGYLLSSFGNVIQKAIMRYVPSKFCNIYVIIAHRV